MLGPLSISCHSQSYSCHFLTYWCSTPLVFIHRKSHLANMMIMLNEKFFFVLSAYLTRIPQLVTCHMTGHYAIHQLPHGYIQWAFQYYRQPSINLIYQTAGFFLCKVALYCQCSFISFVSLHTSHRTQEKTVTMITVFDCLPQGTSHTEHTRFFIM